VSERASRQGGGGERMVRLLVKGQLRLLVKTHAGSSKNNLSNQYQVSSLRRSQSQYHHDGFLVQSLVVYVVHDRGQETEDWRRCKGEDKR
jgi:hypothetical protein